MCLQAVILCTRFAQVRYLARGAQLEVYLDEMTDPVLVAPQLQLHEVLDAEGSAFVGFTAASDGDGAVHELLDWRLSSLDSVTQAQAAPRQLAAPDPTSTASMDQAGPE